MTDLSANGDAPLIEDAAMKAAFARAARLEAHAHKALWHTPGCQGYDLVQKLNQAKSRNDYRPSVKVGRFGDIGDISKTQAFTRYRASILQVIPYVEDVRFTISDGPTANSGAVRLVFDLRKPAQPNRR